MNTYKSLKQAAADGRASRLADTALRSTRFVNVVVRIDWVGG